MTPPAHAATGQVVQEEARNKWPCDLPVSCPGASRWFVEVCRCMALSCKAFLLKKKNKQKKQDQDHYTMRGAGYPSSQQDQPLGI
jgi:hypothetical protein